MLFASEDPWNLRPGKVYGVKLANYSVVLIIDYTHAESGRVLGKNCPFVNVIFVIWILRGVGHPPIERLLRCKTAPATIKYFRSTAVIVEPVWTVPERN